MTSFFCVFVEFFFPFRSLLSFFPEMLIVLRKGGGLSRFGRPTLFVSHSVSCLMIYTYV